MSNLGTFYHIVPRGDGCSYLGIDNFGNIITVKKEGRIDVRLVFKDRSMAEAYIAENLSDNYDVEEFGLDIDYYNTLIADDKYTFGVV